MTSAFDSLMVAADMVVDRIYADIEGWRFQPMVDIPGCDPEIDPDRSAVSAITATFDDQYVDLTTTLPQVPEFGRHATTTPALWVMTQYLPQGVKIMDRFERLSTGQLYAVTNVQPDGIDRVVLTLIEVGQ